MKCLTCLQVQKKHPTKTPRELSPTGTFEATTLVKGTAYCEIHALMAAK